MGVECLYYGGDPSLPDESQEDYVNMAKVKIMDIHPSKNWILTADERSVIALWNYADKELVKYFTVKSLVDSYHMSKDKGAAEMIASKSDIFSPGPVVSSQISSPNNTRAGAAENHSSHDPSPSKKKEKKEEKKKFGLIRDVKFYDQHVLRWRCNCAAIPPSASFTPPDWIIAVCEQRVILINPRTLQSRHITGEQLQGKSPLCCEIVSSSLLAIGCSDGQVRLWDWRNWVLVKSLRAHSKACSALMNVMSEDTNNSEELVSEDELEGFMRMVSVGQDGNCLLWDLHYTGNIIEGNRPTARLEGNVTGSNLISLLYNPSLDTLVAAVGERKALVWDLGLNPTQLQSGMKKKSSFLRSKSSNSSAEVPLIPVLHKIKTPKVIGKLQAMAPLNHPRFPSGSFLACSKGATVGIISTSSSVAHLNDAASDDGGEGGSSGFSEAKSQTEAMKDALKAVMVESFDIRSLLPELPKKLKVYTLRQHPLRHHVVFCGTNIGVFVLSIHQGYASSYALDAHWVSERSPPLVLRLEGDCLRSMAISTDAQSQRPVFKQTKSIFTFELPVGGSGDVSPAITKGKGNSAKADVLAAPQQITDGELFLSPGGRFVAVYSKMHRFYKVLELGTRHGAMIAKKEVDQGSCIGFAWVGQWESFAIIEPPVVVGGEAKKKSVFKKKKRTKNTAGGPTLCIKEIAETGVSLTTSDIAIAQTPAVLFGGTVLCIGFEETEEVEEEGVKAAKPQTNLEGTARLNPIGLENTDSTITRHFSEGSLLKTIAGRSVKDAQMFHWMRRSADSPDDSNRLEALTEMFPCPTLVVWDTEGVRCALFSPKLKRFIIYSVKSGLHRLCSFPALGRSGELPVSARWVGKTLFFATCTEIYAAFVSKGGRSGALCVALASNAVLPSVINTKEIKASSFLPPVQPVKGVEGYASGSGPQILGLWKGELLIGLASQMMGSIDISHPMVRLAMLTVAGEPEKAQKWANAFEPHVHDCVAIFLETYGYVDQALRVPLISPKLFLDLCIKHQRTNDVLGVVEKGIYYMDLCDANPDCASVLHLTKPVHFKEARLSAIVRIGAYLIQADRKDAVRVMIQSCLVHDRNEDACLLALLLGDAQVISDISVKAKNWSTAAIHALSNGLMPMAEAFQEWNNERSGNQVLARLVGHKSHSNIRILSEVSSM